MIISFFTGLALATSGIADCALFLNPTVLSERRPLQTSCHGVKTCFEEMKQNIRGDKRYLQKFHADCQVYPAGVVCLC
jgi:hypothetical protein